VQQKLIELEGGDANILIQWGEGKVVINPSSTTIALDADGLDRLIAALLRARGQMREKERAERATLYARVPHNLKSQFLARATEMDLTQNAAIIAAVRTWLDRLVTYRPE